MNEADDELGLEVHGDAVWYLQVRDLTWRRRRRGSRVIISVIMMNDSEIYHTTLLPARTH